MLNSCIISLQSIPKLLYSLKFCVWLNQWKPWKSVFSREKNEFTAVEFNIYEKFLDIFPFIYLLTFFIPWKFILYEKKKTGIGYCKCLILSNLNWLWSLYKDIKTLNIGLFLFVCISYLSYIVFTVSWWNTVCIFSRYIISYLSYVSSICTCICTSQSAVQREQTHTVSHLITVKITYDKYEIIQTK
jgi:hypothetical protein